MPLLISAGFDGVYAIVDKRSRSRYGKLDARSLADKGLFRAAYRRTVFDGDAAGADYVLEKFNAVSPLKYEKSADLTRVFGVQPPSDDITGVRAV
ncbi:MAG: hypothetical protein CSA76_06780 [Spirochaetales bacterium]|nr:MAG: hypothetical protein CSA76_06780 [Spirochaetales bacterium]